MNRTTIAQRLKTFACALAVVLVAVAAFVATPQAAWAVEYKTEPYMDGDITPQANGSIAPGFKWVAETADMPAHYEIYNPVGDEWAGSTESAIGWWYFSYFSKTHDFDGYLIQLADDISFKEYDWERNSSEGRKQLTVGRDEDKPFKGTFDGQGHTLYNLANARDGLLIDLNCGFFGYTNAAVVKNVNFYDCYVGSSYNGALVVGDATDTLIMNVTATKCTTSVIPPNNVINLITNAGMSGGMIVGNANGSTLYNCEMRGGTVVTNATAGVGALGGQPLYLGGLVGYANDTIIEYSRVADYKEEDGTYTPAYVKNQYGTAVSVANFSEIFTGGIVGAMRAEDSGSKIVDCYSTADVYSEACIYFGVGLGLGVTRGYTGGIAGMVRTGAKDGNDTQLNLIERVSFAGNLHSYNYNIILLGIPAIERDKYMGGITGRGGENATIADAYYMRHRNDAQGENSIWGSTTDEDIYDYKTSYDGGVNDGVNFGYRDDQYADRNFWESCGFDFAENKLRNLGYTFTDAAEDSEWSANHYNKWIMDYDRGIPVHGGSIKATLDFPGSGTTYIGYTSMASQPDSVTDDSQTEPPAQSTANPYDFAVQGFQEGVGQTSLINGEVTHADLDQTIKLMFMRETEAPEDSSWASDDRNLGYRFMGWYRSRDVRVNDIAENHDLFTTPNSTLNTAGGNDGLISDSYEVQKNDSYEADSYTLDVNKPATDEGEGKETDYYDNDLYLAYTQANVLLHDVSGNIIKRDGSATQDGATEDDWYDYGETLTLPTSIASDSDHVSDTALFVGWTTIKNETEDSNGAYVGVTQDVLSRLKDQGEFFEPGSEFTVTEPENLYPVYTDLISNITVVFEGHEQDVSDEGADGASDNVDKRDGYGQAYVRVDNTNETPRYYVAIDDIDMGSNDAADGVIASGPISENYTDSGDGNMHLGASGAAMRFLGWYEEVADDNGDTISVRVSDDPVFYLDDVDLTQKHEYTARFEYLVRYWAGNDMDYDGEPYSQDWVEYNDQRDNPSIAGTNNAFNGWYTAADSYNGVLNVDDDSQYHINGGVLSDQVLNITFPISFHGTWVGSDGNQSVKVSTDFPTGPDYDFSFAGTSSADLTVDMLMDEDNAAGFNFHLWSGEDSSDWWEEYRQFDGTDQSDAWTVSGVWIVLPNWYWFDARLTADVVFHDADSNGNLTVQRGYEDKVIAPAETTQYEYHLADRGVIQGADSVEKAASPTDAEMQRDGYIFLGWIDKNAISQGEFDYIFNGDTVVGTTDVKLVKDVTRAKPYIMDGTEVVRHPMDLYPVYTTFIVETDTNIHNNGQSVVDENIYNIPRDPAVANGGTEDPKVELSYNNDNGTLTSADGKPSPETSATSPVEISYTNYELDSLGNIKAQIKVTPEQKTPLYKDPSTGEGKTYELKSLSVMIDDVEVANLPVDQMNDDGSFAYTIETGVDYTFRANYSPVPVQVIYHFNDTETDLHESNVGDLLPNTTKTPSFSDYEDYFFMGWVVDNSDDAKPVTWDGTTEIDFAEPGVDTVMGTTHLWPVYRQGNVKVESNIDSSLSEPSSIRYTEVRGESLYLVAKDVDGYRFEGWYIDYQDEGARKQLTSAYEYPLRGDARFDGKTYTAVYTSMGDIPQVQYHDTEGNVIYTAYAEGTDENRTFLRKETVDVPEVDPDTGETTFKQEEQWVIIDLDAFNAINAELNEANSADDAQAYEEFVTWQWVDTEDNTPERWGKDETDTDNFINQPVASNVNAEKTDDNVMHLYPVTIKLTATAPADSGTGTENYTGDLRVTELKRDDNDKLSSANVTLLSDYTKGWLKVNLTEYAYNKSIEGSGVASVQTPQTGVKVNLYAPNSATSSPLSTATTVSTGSTDPSTNVELKAGDALFIFNGRLVINKSANEATDGQTFTFKVTDSSGNTRLVPVTVKAVKDAGGNVTGYTGSSRLVLPYGGYIVAEDDWAWRYDSKLSADGGATTSDSVEVEVSYKGIASDGSPAATVVDCANTLTNDDWFSDEQYKHNVFTEGTGE